MGERFGKYELQRRIGSGGMAEVFQAKTFGAEGFEKDVVIKRILPAFSEDPDFVHMFINEARLAVKLQHANIVQIFDFNHIQGIYYIAMEWINGVDLKRVNNTSRRRAKPVPLRFVIHVGVETLKGLHYAHSRREAGAPLQLVHRDISPHNLLVSFSGEVKIADFGIAKATAIASGTRSGAVKGKLAYMSPEQAMVRPLDARSDLFSLGVVLWELLTNRRIYQASSEMELMALVKAAEISSPGAHREEIPEDLEAVIMRLLARDPAQRYSSAEEALNHLHRLGDVGDALMAADYMRRLLPENAAQEGKGGTHVLPPREDLEYRTAGPEVLTMTIGEARDDADVRSRAAAPDARSTPSADDGPMQPGSPDASELRGGTDGSPSPRYDLRRLAVGVLGFFVFGLCGYWITGRASLTPGPARAEVTIQSQPSGAQLLIDGIEMGTTPLRIEAPRGRKVQIEARLGPRRRWAKKLRLRPDQQLQIMLPGEDSSPAGRPAPGRLTAVDSPPSASRTAPMSPKPSPADHTPSAAQTQPQGSRSPPSRKKVPSATPTKPASSATAVAKTVGRRSEAEVVLSSPSRRAQGRGWGLLEVFIAPWANVQLDGKELGQTPLRKRRIRAGVHKLSIYNSELRKRERLKIRVIAGQKTTIRRNWEEGH